MKRTKKKITTIVDELITYFFSVGSDDMVVKVKETPDGYAVFFASSFDPKHTAQVQRLEHFLTCGRAPEIEESYWGLTGMGDIHDENELTLVGSMVDAAQVEICEGHATLNLFRKHGD